MPNSRISPPYGDIYQVGTPYLDKLSDRLYAEHKQRELYKQQQDKSLDDEFKSILPGVRAADTAKLANLWGDYKNSWIQLQRNPPRNQAEYLKQQQDLLRKKANVFIHVNGSKQFGEGEKKIGGLVMADKTGQFADNAHQIIGQGLNTPYDQQLTITDPQTGAQKQIDWTDPDQLRSHIDTKSVMDAIKKAQGDRNAEYIGDKEKATDLQMPKIKAGNNPLDFYSNLLLPATAKTKDFLNTLPHPSDDEYNDKLIQWNTLDPAIKKMWKMNGDLPEEDEIRTPTERAIKYQAMTYGLNPNNQPRVTGYQDDKDMITANRQKFAKAQQQRSFNHAERMALLNQGYKEAFSDYKSSQDEKEQDGILNKFIDTSYNNGTDRISETDKTSSGKLNNVMIDGQKYSGKLVSIPKQIAEQYKTPDAKNEKYLYPDRFLLTDDKKTLVPLFFGSKTPSGNNYLQTYSKPIPIQDYKLQLSKLLLTKKATGSEVVNDELTGNDAPPKPAKDVEIHKQSKSIKDPLGLF